MSIMSTTMTKYEVSYVDENYNFKKITVEASYIKDVVDKLPKSINTRSIVSIKKGSWENII